MKINVCASANSKYVRYLYIMLLSLMENNKKHDLTIYVLTRDFSDSDRDILKKLAYTYDQNINIVDIDESDFKNFPETQKLTLEAYFRLEIIDRLPQTLDRIIYFDVDMIIRGDIGDLYATPLENYYFGACLDMIAYELMPKHRELFGRYDDLRYFNSGMMIWNLDEMRGKISFKDFYAAAVELNFDLPLADQDILNYKYYDHTKYLDPEKFNYMVTKYLRDGWDGYENNNAIVLHFTSISPWAVGPKSPIFNIWWEYARKTPFYVELLEEQLLRVEKHISQTEIKGAVSRPDRGIIIKNLDTMVRYKGKGVFEGLFETDKKYVLYGAGRLAGRLMDVLCYEGLSERIVGVIDRKEEKLFYGLPVYKNCMWMDNNSSYFVIVTPSYDTERIIADVQDVAQKGGLMIEIITITEWLRRLEELTDHGFLGEHK